MPGVEGFIYPNEIELQWSILIVLYPFVTGLVAGAFILASLERVFNVVAVKPTYRLALLTALAFMIVAPLPLQMHLGHPERSFAMFLTPHRESAMAMFGFVYLWYLMVVLLLEIWFDYRKDIVLAKRASTGVTRMFYSVLTLGSDNISPAALRLDDRIGYVLTIIGIPSAFLLHGYVGFIFGSIKANPWWSTPLMPIVFLFSAIVSGIAMVMLIYVASCWLRRVAIDMLCLDTIAKYLFYVFLVDFSLESLDLIHRMYESDESFRALDFMVKTRLFTSQIVLQIIVGTLVPLAILGAGAGDPPGRADASMALRHGRLAGHRRHLRDALERGHRRTALLEELPRLHHLQDGLRHARRTPAGNHRDDPAVRHSLRPAAAPAPVDRRATGIGTLTYRWGPPWPTRLNWLGHASIGSRRRWQRLDSGWQPSKPPPPRPFRCLTTQVAPNRRSLRHPTRARRSRQASCCR